MKAQNEDKQVEHYDPFMKTQQVIGTRNHSHSNLFKANKSVNNKDLCPNNPSVVNIPLPRYIEQQEFDQEKRRLEFEKYNQMTLKVLKNSHTFRTKNLSLYTKSDQVAKLELQKRY